MLTVSDVAQKIATCNKIATCKKIGMCNKIITCNEIKTAIFPLFLLLVRDVA